MKNAILGACLFACALSVAACDPRTDNASVTLPVTAPVTAASVRTYVNEGQLLCNGLAMFSASGSAILAKGASKAAVDDVCALVNAVAVSPEGGVKGTATVTLPSTLVIPLKG